MIEGDIFGSYHLQDILMLLMKNFNFKHQFWLKQSSTIDNQKKKKQDRQAIKDFQL